MSSDPRCPKCNSENTYADGALWVCPECAHEWGVSSTVNDQATIESNQTTETKAVRDAFGNVLTSGDTVTVIKELKIKGSSSAVKVGTKVKNIRLIDADDGHDISCKIDGLGAINLKSEYVKKV